MERLAEYGGVVPCQQQRGKVLAAHLSIERGRARDEAGNDQGEDHQLEEPHEELTRVSYQVNDGVF